MSVLISDESADAALRAASKSGYKELVEDLLKSGVKASTLNGVAVEIAKYYGHPEVVDVLESAIERERSETLRTNTPPKSSPTPR